MDKLNSTEVMLAELIEQNNKQQKDVASMKTSLDTLSGELTKLNNILSPTLKPVKFEEVIPRKDADERAKYLVRMYGDMQAKYANLKAEFGELQAKLAIGLLTNGLSTYSAGCSLNATCGFSSYSLYTEL